MNRALATALRKFVSHKRFPKERITFRIIKNSLRNPKILDIADMCLSEHLFDYMSTGRPITVSEKIGRGLHINEVIGIANNKAPLLLAIRNGNLKEARLLIKNGADIDAVDDTNDTALIWASVNGNLEMVKLLLEAGANTEIKDNNGNTALIWAARENYVSIAELLMRYGADPLYKNIKNVNALEYARMRNHSEIVNLLLRESVVEITTY